MRLFISINFTEEIKNSLCSVIDRLRENSVWGNFTRRDNLHLTLVFIGETAKLSEVKQAMDTVEEPAFTLQIGGFGRFRRTGGDIYWTGAEKSEELLRVYRGLFSALTKAGFCLEDREYTPHLTLGREVFLKDGFDRNAFERSIPQMSMRAEKISLMKSERIDGRLTYTEIYAKTLRETYA